MRLLAFKNTKVLSQISDWGICECPAPLRKQDIIKYSYAILIVTIFHGKFCTYLHERILCIHIGCQLLEMEYFKITYCRFH